MCIMDKIKHEKPHISTINTKQEMYEGYTDLLKQYNDLVDYCNLNCQIGNSDIKKENNMFDLKSIFGDFGAITDGSVAITMNGDIAVRRNDDEYVRYNKQTENMENQMSLVIKEASDMIYVLPVNEVNENDIIRRKNTYYQILTVNKNGSLHVVNIKDGAKKTLIKETNVLGLNFYYKVVSLISEGMNNTLGNVNPMLIMALQDDKDSNDILPLLLMSGGMNTENKTMNNNILPMMLMFSKKDSKMDMKTLMLMQMMNGQNNQQMNPMMMAMLMGDDKMDMKSLMLMQAFSSFSKNAEDSNEKE